MSSQDVVIIISRFDPDLERSPSDHQYRIPKLEGMTVLEALDYIYEYLDGSLAYYDHAACQHGICGRCTLLIDGKPGLMCQTIIYENMRIEPLPDTKVVRDLVYLRRHEE